MDLKRQPDGLSLQIHFIIISLANGHTPHRVR